MVVKDVDSISKHNKLYSLIPSSQERQDGHDRVSSAVMQFNRATNTNLSTSVKNNTHIHKFAYRISIKRTFSILLLVLAASTAYIYRSRSGPNKNNDVIQLFSTYMAWNSSIILSTMNASSKTSQISAKEMFSHDTYDNSPLDHSINDMIRLYCEGDLLHSVQMADIFSDSKHFVDMPIKNNSSYSMIMKEFEEQRVSFHHFVSEHNYRHGFASREWISYQKRLKRFVHRHFDPPGTDLIPVTPIDYHEYPCPPLIAQIKDAEYREWAIGLHHLWKHLGRVPNTQVQGSFLHVKTTKNGVRRDAPRHVIVVPGGRFRESYYWDSYWIVTGLLISNMMQTARGVVNNLLQYVENFGFVPNGGRIYYLTRSQPPMLSEMVKLVAQINSASESRYDLEYLKYATPLLDREYAFWMRHGSEGHAVQVIRHKKNKSGQIATVAHVLNRYLSSASRPRPEAYREDVNIASDMYPMSALSKIPIDQLSLHHKTRLKKLQQSYYNDIIAAAESGWDFSSRWLRNGNDLHSVFTSHILPVDLNAMMYRMEINLMHFHLALQNHKRANTYKTAASSRKKAIQDVLWYEAGSCWRDYILENGTHSTINSVSDYMPLWAKAFDSSDSARLDAIITSFGNSDLIRIGGVQTTTFFTGQQWDSPNAWAPAQDMLIEAMLNVNTLESNKVARMLAKLWIQTSFTAWKNTGLMFEKYNATELGGLGVGGEYFPQFGFGWSNGVVLKILTTHHNLLREDSSDEKSTKIETMATL